MLTMKVLILEDDAVTAMLIDTLLRDVGYIGTTALDGDTAYSHVENHAFDAVILDWSVPGTHSSLEVATKFLEKTPTGKVIFTTGHAQNSLPKMEGSLQNSLFFKKPVDYDQVIIEIGKGN